MRPSRREIFHAPKSKWRKPGEPRQTTAEFGTLVAVGFSRSDVCSNREKVGCICLRRVPGSEWRWLFMQIVIQSSFLSSLFLFLASNSTLFAEDRSFESFVSNGLQRLQHEYSETSYDCFIITTQSSDGDLFEFRDAQLQRTVVVGGKFASRQFHLFTEEELETLGIEIALTDDVPEGLDGFLNHTYLKNPDYSSTISRSSTSLMKFREPEWTATEIRERGGHSVNDGQSDIDPVSLFAYADYSTEKTFAQLLDNAGEFSVVSWSEDGDRGSLIADITVNGTERNLHSVFDLVHGECLTSTSVFPDTILTCEMSYYDRSPRFLRAVMLEGVSRSGADPEVIRKQYFFKPNQQLEAPREIFYLSHYGIAEPKFGHSRVSQYFIIALLASCFLLAFYQRFRWKPNKEICGTKPSGKVPGN